MHTRMDSRGRRREAVSKGELLDVIAADELDESPFRQAVHLLPGQGGESNDLLRERFGNQIVRGRWS